MNAVLLLSLLAVASSQDAPPAPNRSAEPDKPKADCVVRGRVLNAVTGEPLKKSTVNLRKQTARNAGRQVDVAADGTFVFTAVEPGRYALSASRTGFVTTSYGARRPSGPGTQITLAPGQELKDLAIQLNPHAVITGRVTDEDGEPMASVSVSASRFVWQGRRRELQPAGGSDMTNDLGEYRIFGVAPGSYIIRAVRRQDFGMPYEPEPASAKVEESYVTTYYPGTTDSATAPRVTARSGAETRGIDIRMIKSRVVRLRGNVLNASGKPVSAGVYLAPRNRGWGAWDETHRVFVQDPSQGFDLRNVPPGQYTLTAQSVGASDDRQSASMPIDVGDHNISDLVVRLSPGMDVSGTVKVEGGTLDGPPAQVYLESADGEGPGFMVGGAGPVKDDGTFTIRGVQAGRYRVRVSRPEAYLKTATAGDEDLLDNPLEIGPEGAPKLELVLSLKGAEVSGTVKGSDGKLVSGAQVILFPEEKRRTEWSAFGMGTTDQYGAFKMKGLRPGEYKALAFEDFEIGDQVDPDFLKPIESKAKVLKLTEGATETADLDVIPAETVATEKAKRQQ